MTKSFASKSLAVLAALIGSVTVANATPYYASGVQTNVSMSSLEGWSTCYVGTYNDYNVPLANVLNNCQGTYMMLAAGANSTFTVLAAALRSDVIYSTPGPNEGGDRMTTHAANGVEWYYSPNWSWGFANGGDTVYRNSCDYGDSFDGTNWLGDTSDTDRLCWHTYNGSLYDGWRAGANDGTGPNIYGPGFYRYILVSDTAGDLQPPPPTDVPAPGALALLGLGLLGVGAIRKKARAA